MLSRAVLLLILATTGCATHHKAARAGCRVEHGQMVCNCRRLEVMSQDVKDGFSILKCEHGHD